MICQICKINSATIHIHKILNGKDESLDICQTCATEKNLVKELASGLTLNLAELLQTPQLTYKKNKLQLLKEQDLITPDHTCPNCHWTTEDLKRTGRLGCCQCWSVFKEILDHAIPLLHRGNAHHLQHDQQQEATLNQEDKKSLRYVETITKLESDLQHLIEIEAYEKAAILRDKITELKMNFLHGNEHHHG